MVRRAALLLNSFCLFGPLFVCLLLLTHQTWYGPDIWYHLTWGRDIIDRGSVIPVQRSLFEQPIPANLYWLFQTIVYGLYRISGTAGVSAVFSAIWIVIVILWMRLASLTKAPPFAGVLFLGAFIICAQLRFDQRPEVFAYVFLLVLLLCLSDLDLSAPIRPKSLAVLIITQTLLTNTHGYFAFGPLLGAALIISCLWRRRPSRELSHGFLVFLILTAGSFLSPNGYRSWEVVHAYDQLGRAISALNAELFPTWQIDLLFPIAVFWLYWGVVFILFLRSLWIKENAFALIIAAAGLYLGASMFRNIALCFILTAPLLRTTFSKRDLSLAKSRALGAAQVCSALAAVVFATCIVRGDYHRWTMSLATFGSWLERASYPLGAVQYLNKIGFQGRLFTDSYDGGYVEFQRPDLQIAGDSYFIDPLITTEFFQAIKDRNAFELAELKYRFDGLLINIENQSIVDALWVSAAWRLVYADSHRVLFLRSGRDQDRLSMTTPTYYEGDDLTRWMYTFSPVTWIQIALKFNDVGLAKKLLDDLQNAERIPSTTIRGALILALSNRDRSLAERAAALMPKSFVSDPADPDAIQKMTAQLRGK